MCMCCSSSDFFFSLASVWLPTRCYLSSKKKYRLFVTLAMHNTASMLFHTRRNMTWQNMDVLKYWFFSEFTYMKKMTAWQEDYHTNYHVPTDICMQAVEKWLKELAKLQNLSWSGFLFFFLWHASFLNEYVSNRSLHLGTVMHKT